MVKILGLGITAELSVKFSIHMSNFWMHVISRFTVLRGKTLTLDITHKLFYQFFSYLPYLVIGTIDFYHLNRLSVTLTLAGGHKVSAKQNLLASFPHLFFNRSK